MSTTVRQYWLKTLRLAGVKHFRATSGLGLPYICHVGDFAGELPFYARRHSVEELSLMAGWCRTVERPVIFDVGANNGFIATQLAQLLKDRSPLIYAFEPIPSTFAQLEYSTEVLGLQSIVRPVCCALSNSPGITSMAYNPRESLFAQIRDDTTNARVGARTALVPVMTIDGISTSLGVAPSLIKLDVEGFESNVLRGAVSLLKPNERPAMCFEWNYLTLSEANSSPAAMLESLQDYCFYYVDDFQNQRKPFGTPVSDLMEIDWVCNIFAVPKGHSWDDHWQAALKDAQRRLTRA